MNSELIQDEVNFTDVSAHEIETRTDTGAPALPVIQPWSDAGSEPPLLDPFQYASTNQVKKRIGGKRNAFQNKEGGDNAAEVVPSGGGASGVSGAAPATGKERKKGSSGKGGASNSGEAGSGASAASIAQDEKIAEAIKEAKKMNPKDLKEALKKRNLGTQGNKQELLARLLEAIKASPPV